MQHPRWWDFERSMSHLWSQEDAAAWGRSCSTILAGTRLPNWSYTVTALVGFTGWSSDISAMPKADGAEGGNWSLEGIGLSFHVRQGLEDLLPRLQGISDSHPNCDYQFCTREQAYAKLVLTTV